MVTASRHTALFSCCFLSCLLFLFYPGIISSEIPAFRDAYHFYYPQAVWLDDCAARGDYFPRWNTGAGLGSSVPGQTSSALYYPLRVLWLIPSLTIAQRFSVYIVVHLMIAALGIAYAARKLGFSANAGCLAATSYALSCPVLFQHTNLIFLTSAAWVGFALSGLIEFCKMLNSTAGLRPATDENLPVTELAERFENVAELAESFENQVKSSKVLATSATAGTKSSATRPTDNAKNNRRPRFLISCVVFSVATALMIVGGDPHTAVNTWIVATCAVIVMLIRAWRNSYRQLESRFAVRVWGMRVFGWFALAATFVFTTTAIQLIPAIRWSKHSNRFGQPTTASIATAGTPVLLPVAEVLATQHIPIRHSVYDFSISPWHIATTVWPTLGGHYLPDNSRWFSQIPAEGRMWIPSIYFGFIPFILVISAFQRGVRRAEKEDENTPVAELAESFENQDQTSKVFASNSTAVPLSCRSKCLLTLALFALLASLGNYSIIWMLRQLCNATGLEHFSRYLPYDHVGSVYWILTATIPGYDSFRYPGKWTVWFVAGCSLLAAGRLDDFTHVKVFSRVVAVLVRRTVLLFSIVILVIAIGLLVWLWMRSGIGPHQLSLTVLGGNTQPDAWFGLPDTRWTGWTFVIASIGPLVLFPLASAFKGKWRSGVKFLLLLEMTLVSTCWTAWSEAPVSETVLSETLRSEMRSRADPFVWSDTSGANLTRDKLRDNENEFLDSQTDYQDTFLLGKLANLARVRNLATSQSITPVHIVRLRRWLARRDNLTPDQPKLDRVLACLGVTHRLVRMRESSTFIWQPVVGTRPLCELLTESYEPLQEAELEWTWRSTSELVITINSETAAHLLFRQFNDGGWTATIEDSGNSPQALEIRPTSAHFIDVLLPAGHATITVRRKWLW